MTTARRTVLVLCVSVVVALGALPGDSPSDGDHAS